MRYKKLLIPIVSVLLIVSVNTAYAAVAFDATSDGGGGTDTYNDTTPLEWSHTTAGSDRVLIVAVYIQDDTNKISTVTYNSVSMTRIIDQALAANQHIEFWYLAAPATGANTISVDFDGPILRTVAAANSFTGAEQTFGGATADAASGSGSPTVNITTNQDNSMIIDMAAGGDTDIGTVGANQTERNKQLNVAGNHDAAMSTEPTTTAGSYTMSWAGGQVWNIAAAEIREKAAAPAPTRKLKGSGITR